jgi:hypothetical protein
MFVRNALIFPGSWVNENNIKRFSGIHHSPIAIGANSVAGKTKGERLKKINQLLNSQL